MEFRPHRFDPPDHCNQVPERAGACQCSAARREHADVCGMVLLGFLLAVIFAAGASVGFALAMIFQG